MRVCCNYVYTTTYTCTYGTYRYSCCVCLWLVSPAPARLGGTQTGVPGLMGSRVSRDGMLLLRRDKIVGMGYEAMLLEEHHTV
jgi:hypothetical protein